MSIKSLSKNLVRTLVTSDIGWKVISPLAKAGISMNKIRTSELKKKAKEEDNTRHLFKEMRVLHGPFKGMKYPSFKSVGSTLYSKLVGSYEWEIHAVIESYCTKDYKEIIDVGCAEGYYAVGLAMRLPNAKIYAYDAKPEAQTLCKEMAMLNGVSDKVMVHGFLTPEELRKFPFTKGLIICDCEGFEKMLFTKENVSSLKSVDLLIEAHDFIDITISTYLTDLFSPTHNIQVIKSIDDIEKAKTYHFEETEGLTLQQKRKIFKEGRPTIMEWLICTPK